MALQTKKTVMAVVEEINEGVPVAPSSGNDYFATQEGFELVPQIDTLDNAELTGSLGFAKPIQGMENPTASFSHYLRGSSFEGVESDFALLIYAAFGDKTVNAVEYDTIAASTAGDADAAAIIKVDAAEGLSHYRGQALLIKDSGLGHNYSVRNIESISTDDLILAFNLDDAPGVGINLGKAITYFPGEAHPTLSIWNYRANGGAIELISGAKVTEMSVEITAGDLINAAFSFEGMKFYFDSLLVDASNKYLDFDIGGLELNAEIAIGMYRDPYDLAGAIERAMDDLSADEITVSYDKSNGKYNIASDGITLNLLWKTGVHGSNNTDTHIGSLIGYSDVADDAAATDYDGDLAIDITSPYTPIVDSADPLVAKANECLMGDFADKDCICAATVGFTLANSKVNEPCVCSDTGKSGTEITGREVTVSLTGLTDSHEQAEKFKRFRTNQKTQFAYTAGLKVGGNWVAGSIVNLFIPSATITDFKLGDLDGMVSYEISLKAYVEGGLDEVYLNNL